jgi:hypothetical protein
MQQLDSGKAENERGRVTRAEFADIYKDLATRPEIYFLMVRYANKDYLTWEDMQMFLETEQGVSGLPLVCTLTYRSANWHHTEHLRGVDGEVRTVGGGTPKPPHDCGW